MNERIDYERLPVDFDYTRNFARARREQSKAVFQLMSSLVRKVSNLVRRDAPERAEPAVASGSCA